MIKWAKCTSPEKFCQEFDVQEAINGAEQLEDPVDTMDDTCQLKKKKKGGTIEFPSMQVGR